MPVTIDLTGESDVELTIPSSPVPSRKRRADADPFPFSDFIDVDAKRPRLRATPSPEPIECTKATTTDTATPGQQTLLFTYDDTVCWVSPVSAPESKRKITLKQALNLERFYEGDNFPEMPIAYTRAYDDFPLKVSGEMIIFDQFDDSDHGDLGRLLLYP